MKNFIKEIAKRYECYLIIVDNSTQLDVTSDSDTFARTVKYCNNFYSDGMSPLPKESFIHNKVDASYYENLPRDWYDILLSISKGPLPSGRSPIIGDCNENIIGAIKGFNSDGLNRVTGIRRRTKKRKGSKKKKKKERKRGSRKRKRKRNNLNKVSKTNKYKNIQIL